MMKRFTLNLQHEKEGSIVTYELVSRLIGLRTPFETSD